LFGTSAGRAFTGPRLQVYLRLFSAICVECSDEKSGDERTKSRIRGNLAKALRHCL